MSISIHQKYMSARTIDAPLDVGDGSAEAYRGKSYSRLVVGLMRALSSPPCYSTEHHEVKCITWEHVMDLICQQCRINRITYFHDGATDRNRKMMDGLLNSLGHQVKTKRTLTLRSRKSGSCFMWLIYMLWACLDTLRSDARWSAAADARIGIFAAFLDSPDAVQNPATIQSGGLQKRRRREAFGVIFSDSRISPSVIVEKAYPNRQNSY
jgi:hypothetical protein